jgi:acetylornithine deacetylase/succinyl-diaminopimelate desuccinylase-like protein
MMALSPHAGAIGAEAGALITEWCAIPSTAANPAALREMAGRVAAYCRGLGAAVSEPALALDPPLVHARLGEGDGATALLYNMYDVMPADEAGWPGDPWRATRHDLPGIGPSLVARGTENNKGPLAVMLATVAALVRVGQLTRPIEILVEGQEECGSTVLRHYLARQPCPAGPAQVTLFPSLCEYGGGPPRLYLGFKGIAQGTLRCAAGAWGAPSRGTHSSNAPWIASPAWQLVAALAALAEPPTGRIGTVALPQQARALVAALAAEFDPAAELRFRGTARYAIPGDAAALLERVLAEASLNISGLGPAGASAFIPAEAWARFDLRAPPGLDPRALADGLASTLRERGIEGIALAHGDAYPGHAFGEQAPGVAQAIAAYRANGAEPQVWPWAPGAAPAYAFAPVSPAFLIFGLGRGGGAHGPGEFATLAGLERLAASLLSFLHLMAQG